MTRSPNDDAPTVEAGALTAEMAENLVPSDKMPAAPNPHERDTTRELPPDPDASGAQADRAALDAARLIVVGEPRPSMTPSRAPPPPPHPHKPSRAVVIALFIAVAVLASAAGVLAGMAAGH